MNRHQALASLQSLDTRRRRLVDRIEAINDELASAAEVDEARAELEQLRAAQAFRLTSQRAAEAAVVDVQAHVDREEKRLYDGSVKAPKELASLQEEVNHLKDSRAAREETLMGIFTEVEEAEPVVAAQATRVDELAAARAAREAELGDEMAAAEAEIASIDLEAAAIRDRLENAVLRIYDDLSRRKAGIGVAMLKGSLCGVCRVTAPDSVRRRTNDLEQVVQCPNCERILIPEP